MEIPSGEETIRLVSAVIFNKFFVYHVFCGQNGSAQIGSLFLRTRADPDEQITCISQFTAESCGLEKNSIDHRKDEPQNQG